MQPAADKSLVEGPQIELGMYEQLQQQKHQLLYHLV